MPRLTEPAAQPTSAPAPTQPAVTPPSSAPAPAGSKVERGLGSMRGANTNPCDTGNRLRSRISGNFVIRIGRRARGADPRERWQRRDGVGGRAAARGAGPAGGAETGRAPPAPPAPAP